MLTSCDAMPFDTPDKFVLPKYPSYPKRAPETPLTQLGSQSRPADRSCDATSPVFTVLCKTFD